MLSGFATQAAERSYCRPEMNDSLSLEITAGRHPVIETLMAQFGSFVPAKAARIGYFDNISRREPRPLPVMKLNPAVKDIFEFRYEDFTLEGYDPWPGIRAPVAV